MLNIRDLRLNSAEPSLCTPVTGLDMSWKLQSDNQNVKQVSYRAIIRCADTAASVWDSDLIKSAKQVHIPVDMTLASRTDYTLTVTVTDNHGETATAILNFATALNPEDWQGKWIKPKKLMMGWAPYLRRKFSVTGPVVKARLYVSGLGCGEYYVNNQKISEDLIDPPMTNYEREVFYRAYDVTPFIKEGKNAFAALLGEGFYAQSRVWSHEGFYYGDACLMAQLELTFGDGTKNVIATDTDGNWSYKYSPIVLNNLYGGETYDTRLETPDFADPDGDEDGWCAVAEDTTPKGALTPCLMPPVRIFKELPALSVTNCSGKDDGAWIIDFGENIAGFVEVRLPRAARGSQVTLRFAENLDSDGHLDFRSAGSFATQVLQQDVYISRGDEQGETWRPRFTYHAFRYMEITGYFDLRAYGTNPETWMFKAYAISTDLKQTGSFTSSSEDMNRLQAIMMNTFRTNYHGFPEDCPGREKCGWLGDAQVVCNTGMMNYDTEAAYEKYLNDIRTTNEVYGVWQMISPGKRGCGEATPLWGCAQIIIPYWMYYYYGNENVVRKNWDMMEKWVQHEINDAKADKSLYDDELIISRGLGDWCPPIGHDHERRMPVPESSTAMFYEIMIRMSELSKVLNLPASIDYDHWAARIKEAFNRHFWIPEKHRYATWGTCGVALMTGLYPEGEKEALTEALLTLMKEDDYAMSTGIYCNKYLVPALCEAGQGDVAMKYLFNRDHDSFGTMMDKGATSLWECPEHDFSQPREVGSSSYNHPMHSGFAYFLYAYVGGITPVTPGFKTFAVAPVAFTDMREAEVIHECPYGKIRIAFRPEGDATRYEITVPAGTTCAFVPTGKTLGSGDHVILA